MTDECYMKKALELAKKGMGWVNPNPMVGCVIVKNGNIIGAGYHKCYGEAHAERNAIFNCVEPPKGSILYVTLEPCCHVGKTPPCTQAIIESGISRVVIGSSDPNPLVSGKGVQLLQNHGVDITEGVLKDDCDSLNKVFFHYIKTKKPYILMKYAMTMDGKLATYSGKSKWITGEDARNRVQSDRHLYSGIMVGVNTVLADNPLLTCRLPNSKSPVRIICDTNLKTPLNSNIVQTAKQYKTIIATCCFDNSKIGEYENAGCEVFVVSQKDGFVNLNELMDELAKIGVDSIILEGGSTLNWSALNSGIVNKVQVYIASKLFGGTCAKSPIGGIGVESPNEAYKLSPPRITQLGDDILLESEVVLCSQE